MKEVIKLSLIIICLFCCKESFADAIDSFMIPEPYPYDIDMRTAYSGCIAGEGGIYTSWDGEQWFHVYGAPGGADSNDAIVDIELFNDSIGYAVGWKSEKINDTLWQFYGLILKTVTSGDIWFEVYQEGIAQMTMPEWRKTVGNHQSQRSSFHSLFSLTCVSQDYVIIGGSAGFLLRTQNGGATWEELPPTMNSAYRLMYAGNNLYGGFWQKFGRSLDGGITWQSLLIAPTTTNCFTVNGERVYIGGSDMQTWTRVAIAYTTDHGAHWIKSIQSDSGQVNSVFFVDAQVGYAAASIPMAFGVWNAPRGYIYKTSDGGASWVKIYEREWVEVMGVSSAGQYVYFAAGSRVLRLELSTIGIPDPHSEIPRRFALTQNYPNPFNPITKISYSLPTKTSVKISLFDIVGKEVAVLENTVQNPGKHEVSFNASNLSSGIYFYKIVASDFVETKKMILVK